LIEREWEEEKGKKLGEGEKGKLNSLHEFASLIGSFTY
jgi:hypothetical protein